MKPKFIIRKRDDTWKFTQTDWFLINLALVIGLYAFMASGSRAAYKGAFNSVKMGMTKAQVVKIMGKPDNANYKSHGEQMLRWTCTETRSASRSSVGRTSVWYFYVYFNADNKVYKKSGG